METNLLIEKVEKLPESLKKEVENFVDFLIFKDQHQEKNVETKNCDCTSVSEESINSYDVNDSAGLYNKEPKLKREFGGLKGQIWMSDDFDKPLDDFKDYM